MKFEKINTYLVNPETKISERSFVVTSSIAAATLTVIFFWDIYIGESLAKLIMLGAAVFSMYILVPLCVRFQKVSFGSVVVSLAVIVIVLPVEFFTGGGVYGCTPIWFAYAFLYIGLNIVDWKKYLMLVLLLLSVLICYVISYYWPEYLTIHGTKIAYMDSAASVIGVGVMLYVTVSFLLRIYNSERALAQRQKEEIDYLNKSQNQFFSNMSHEIRTPINTIIGLNEMILREDISEEVASDALNIQAASKMLLHLINDILDMSKIESGKMEITPVIYNSGDMLSDIVGMLWLRAEEKGLGLHVEVDPSLPAELVGDEVKIKQILINVLTNAVKYTKKGSVTLSIECEKGSDRNAVITYSVSDTGMGIKKESLPHLFSAFQRIDEKKNRYIEGTGLGLSIVKQFVDMMGGEITVNSVYTKGSTFIIKLPQEIANGKEIGEFNVERRHSLNRRKHYKQSFEAPEARVLVVDDTRANLLVVQKLLRATKVQIDLAENGISALSKTLEQKYHVIFMDHMMPEMDGIECMHRIREQAGGLCKEAKIIALTANAGSENRLLYANEGFDGYLLKPVSGEELEHELVRNLPGSLVHMEERAAVLLDGKGTELLEHKKRLPVLVTTESVSDLPKDATASRNIPVIAYHIFTEEGYFLDGVEADADGLLNYMVKKKKDAHSAPPGVERYEAFFAEQLLRANNVIHISMAKGVSAAFEEATEAAGTFDNVHVVDCGHLSSGMGLVALAANQMAMKGYSVEQILSELEKVKKAVHTSFIVDTLDYLVKAKRVNDRLRKFASAFMIHPVLVLRKSRMVVGKIYVGTKRHVWKGYIKSAFETMGEIDRSILFVTYAGLTREELSEIEQEIREKMAFDRIIFQKASSAISSNCGPGTFGLLFQTKIAP